jgi:hypothetical protein
MAAFRKLVLGMAAATVFAAIASAQSVPALQCVANAGVPPTIRAEGLTELVGDVTLNCSALPSRPRTSRSSSIPTSPAASSRPHRVPGAKRSS